MRRVHKNKDFLIHVKPFVMVPQLSCRNQEAVRAAYGINSKQGWTELTARLKTAVLTAGALQRPPQSPDCLGCCREDRKPWAFVHGEHTCLPHAMVLEVAYDTLTIQKERDTLEETKTFHNTVEQSTSQGCLSKKVVSI